MELKKQEIDAEQFFWQYYLRDTEKPEHLLQPKLVNLDALQLNLDSLKSYDQGHYNQDELRHCIRFVRDLGLELRRLMDELTSANSDLTSTRT